MSKEEGKEMMDEIRQTVEGDLERMMDDLRRLWVERMEVEEDEIRNKFEMDA